MAKKKQRQHFAFRFNNSERDQWLREQIDYAVDNDSINLSEIIKRLLVVYFAMRYENWSKLTEYSPESAPLVVSGAVMQVGQNNNGHRNGHKSIDEDKEDPTDILVQRMVNISFDEM